jgi:hypothetical protein
MKVCSKCKKLLPLDQFYINQIRKGKVIYRGSCKKCKLEQDKEAIAKRPDRIEKLKKYQSQYGKSHRDKMNKIGRDSYYRNLEERRKVGAEIQKKRRVEQPEKTKEIQNKCKRKQVAQLTDGYIKDILHQEGIGRELTNQFPILVDSKKIKIAAKRIKKVIKKRQNETKHSSTISPDVN